MFDWKVTAMGVYSLNREEYTNKRIPMTEKIIAYVRAKDVEEASHTFMEWYSIIGKTMITKIEKLI